MEQTTELKAEVSTPDDLIQALNPEGFIEAELKTGRVFRDVIVEKGNPGTTDGSDRLSLEGMIVPEGFIPVTVNWNHPVGNASLFMKDDYLMANVNIMDYPAFEKLVAQKIGVSSKVYPAVSGVVLEKEGNVIKKFRLSSVSLCSSNADTTIPPINLD